MIQQRSLWCNQQWVAVAEPTGVDITELTQHYGIPREYVSYILDPKERARFDYNFKHGCSMFVFRMINRITGDRPKKNVVETRPVYLIVKDNVLITVAGAHSQNVTELMNQIVTDEHTVATQSSLHLLAISLMLELNKDYFDRINELDDLRERLEGYHNRPSNAQIEQLSQLSKSLIYLKAAASGNGMAVKQLQVMSDSKDDPIKLTRDEQQQLRDLATELAQSTEMAQINREIVQQLADAYSNVLDKGLNDTMRLLTIWSLALAVPPIVSGFYGMNVKLPLLSGWLDWPISVLLSLVPVVVMIWYLRAHHDL